MLNYGGPRSFCHPRGIRDPSLDRDNLNSPDTQRSPGGGERGEAPPEDYDYEEPTTIGQSGSEREMDDLPVECLDVTAVNASANQACFDWCWNHFATGQDGFICEDLTDMDLAQGCTFSSGADCRAEQERRGAEEASAEAQRTARLRECETNLIGDLDWCTQQCETTDFEYDFCPQLCLVGRWSETEYCRSLAEAEPPSGDGCPSGWSEPRFDSLEITWDGCYPYIGNIHCCDVVGDDDLCRPVPGNDQNFACTNNSWCGCYENFGVVRNFTNCMAPRSGGPWEIHRRSDYRTFYGGALCQRRRDDDACDCWSPGGPGSCVDLVDCEGGFRSMAQCIPYGSCSR